MILIMNQEEYENFDSKIDLISWFDPDTHDLILVQDKSHLSGFRVIKKAGEDFDD